MTVHSLVDDKLIVLYIYTHYVTPLPEQPLRAVNQSELMNDIIIKLKRIVYGVLVIIYK